MAGTAAEAHEMAARYRALEDIALPADRYRYHVMVQFWLKRAAEIGAADQIGTPAP